MVNPTKDANAIIACGRERAVIAVHMVALAGWRRTVTGGVVRYVRAKGDRGHTLDEACAVILREAQGSLADEGLPVDEETE